MCPLVNSDESVSANRSAHVVRYTDHSSQRPKEQISASKNAQTEYETQNAAYSSTYGSNSQHSNIEESQRNITRNPEKTEQKHKSVDTYDTDSSLRHQSKSCCVKLHLCCLRLCRAKKRCSERVLRKPTRRVLKRIKTQCKGDEKHDDTVAVASVSTTPHRESISHRDASKKSKSRKQNGAVDKDVIDKDISEDTREERKAKKKREREERKRKVMIEDERRGRKERHKREEHVPHPVDTHLVARDDDLPVKVMKPPLITDLAKSCCYLCAQNALAIASVSRPEQSDKSVQVSTHKFHTETAPMLDKSCSPILLMRTVQSSVKVRTWETTTMCPSTSAVPREETRPRAKKRKKFAVFPGLTRTKCAAGRHAACKTDKLIARRDDNAEKREPRNERCCREKNT